MQSRLENPFAASAEFIRHNLPVFLDMAKHKELEALTARLELMYRNAGEQAGIYLSEIQKIVPDSGERVDYQWFRGKNRSPLYAAVAQNLYRRALLGEFNNRTYFPSEP